jgi:phosphohistidine phosphatase
MKNIFLFRHGKSNWTNPDHTDSERPLAKRGLRDVPVMSKIISEKCSNIDLILCSSSKRTCETLELSLSAFSKRPEIKILDELYLASSERLLSILNKYILNNNNIILIGHNPGLFDFVTEIDDALLFLFPTSAVCHLLLHNNQKPKLEYKDFKIDTAIKPKDILLS